MILLATVTLCCGAVAGTLALLEPATARPPDELLADLNDPRTPAQIPVRVVGAPFEPNVNPRER